MKFRDLSLFCLCVAALISGRADAKCQLTRYFTLHAVVEGNQILIPGRLGGEPVKFLFDTSFPGSVVMGPTAKRLGLELLDFRTVQENPIRSLIGHTETGAEGGAIAPEFDLDGHTVRHALFAMFGDRDSFGGTDVAAVLGADYWSQYEVDIDLAKGEINLLKAEDCDDVNLAYWAQDYNVVDLHTANYQSRFESELNGRKLMTILDSGSPFSSLTRRGASMAGPPLDKEIDADVWHPGQQATDLLSLTKLTYGLGTRMSANLVADGNVDLINLDPVARTTVANFGSFKLDEEVIKPARFRIVPTPKAKPETGSLVGMRYFDYDVVLGVDFLLAHHVLIANNQHKLYFSYSGGKALQTVSK